jgi:DNA-binding GntR family transcriptional regulator
VRVADWLRERILAGQYAPGDHLRQEEVAGQLAASRLPVREALRILEAEGLVEHQANRGARVTLLDAHQVDVIYQLRERLEPLVLAESIPALDAGAFEALRAVQAELERESADVERFLVLDRRFHFMTYGGCRVEQLSSLVVRFWNSTQAYRRRYLEGLRSERLWVANAEHQLLLDAIGRRDVLGAQRQLAEHIRRTRIELLHEARGGTPTEDDGRP